IWTVLLQSNVRGNRNSPGVIGRPSCKRRPNNAALRAAAHAARLRGRGPCPATPKPRLPRASRRVSPSARCRSPRRFAPSAAHLVVVVAVCFDFRGALPLLLALCFFYDADLSLEVKICQFLVHSNVVGSR